MSIQGTDTSKEGGFSALLRGGGLALFVASCVMNGSTFLFHVVMSRMLGPGSYGALGSLMGLITVVTFASTAIQAAVTQAVADRPALDPLDTNPLALRKQTTRTLLAAGGACFLTAASFPALDSYLHLSSPIPVIGLSLFVGLSILALVSQGVLLGQQSFRVVAVALVACGVVRITTGVVFADLGFGLDGALAATVLSMVVMLGVQGWPLRHQIWSSEGDVVSLRFSSAALAVAALGGFSALVGVDVFLARHYLAASASGQYAAAATAARIVIFLPSAIALIAFPKFVASGGVGQEARRILANALLAVAGLSVIAIVTIVAVPHLVISLTFGSQYQAAATPMRILCVTAGGLGLISIFVYFHLARYARRSLVPWIGVLLAVGSIAIWHSNPRSLAWSMASVTALTLVLVGLRVFASTSRDRDTDALPREAIALGG